MDSMKQIFDAVSENNLAVLEEIIRQNPQTIHSRNDAGETLLHTIQYDPSSPQPAIAVLELLLSMNMDVNIPDNSGIYPIHKAVSHDDRKATLLLIENGANVNSADCQGQTPLYWASVRECKVLLNNGADINYHNFLGQTPLHDAAREADYRLVKYLLIRGANVNARDNKLRTPLHVAASGYYDVIDYADIANILLRCGADVNAQDERGQTPLHYASTGDDPFLAKINVTNTLLEAGADKNMRDISGKLPIDLARLARFRRIIQLLE